MIAPQPVIAGAFGFFIGMLVIFYPEMFRRLLDRIGNAAVLFIVVLIYFILRHIIQMIAFPRGQLICVIALRDYFRSALQHQHLQAPLTQFFRGHAAAHS